MRNGSGGDQRVASTAGRISKTGTAGVEMTDRRGRAKGRNETCCEFECVVAMMR